MDIVKILHFALKICFCFYQIELQIYLYILVQNKERLIITDYFVKLKQKCSLKKKLKIITFSFNIVWNEFLQSCSFYVKPVDGSSRLILM